MSDGAEIYERIWDADVAGGNGVKAVSCGTPVSAELRASGYVVVDERKSPGADRRVLAEVEIPEGKQHSYRLAERLFNNYTLDQRWRETRTVEEQNEVQEFIEFLVATTPMQLARDYVQQRSGRSISDDSWWHVIERVWFEEFGIGNNLDLSGFEHVIVGEQKQGKVQGYHFWYKYHLDENFQHDEVGARDLITFKAFKDQGKEQSPEVVTLSYQWDAFDYERKAFRKLIKPIGGFWVGLSVEALMAIGTIRFLPEAKAPRRCDIHGVTYDLEMFRSPDGRNLRTFYPVVVGMKIDPVE